MTPFLRKIQWGVYIFLNTILYCIDLLGGYLELVVKARRGLGKIKKDGGHSAAVGY